VVLFKICSYISRIPNYFPTGSEKLPKISQSLKIFSRTTSARTEQKAVP
jgi:hypothetical protein